MAFFRNGSGQRTFIKVLFVCRPPPEISGWKYVCMTQKGRIPPLETRGRGAKASEGNGIASGGQAVFTERRLRSGLLPPHTGDSSSCFQDSAAL